MASAEALIDGGVGHGRVRQCRTWVGRSAGMAQRATPLPHRRRGRTITFVGLGGLLDLLKMPDAVEAARRLAIGLMRKGRGAITKYHDESHADDMFSALLFSGEPEGG